MSKSESEKPEPSEPIPVGVADYALSTDERPLRTSGVGSCGVVAIHDEISGVSGLLHFMLPEIEDRNNDHADAKFADAGIAELLSAFESAGGCSTRAWAKLAGGATMIGFDSFDRPIGDRNVEAAQIALEERNIPLCGTDVGGDTGRKVVFEPATGELVITTANGATRRR
ncbi:chemoreceptor glutamine deamidase CheD [Natrialba chahannaoensis JCM 10990]|uniref:Probable chemoreceptor glutamine deamidase CheD n=1 Tax=Natrialba chahannaoensis JCM 10990 TaxID=1227492 RepID=M0A5M9_9EURY|nr:chemotaxis protein CheD [Natrialba chahannaoensis]ELY94025.1 chemoreceptor glutamine deamidase CheD [Natrialba chahannaoensis JCM 10990]